MLARSSTPVERSLLGRPPPGGSEIRRHGRPGSRRSVGTPLSGARKDQVLRRREGGLLAAHGRPRQGPDARPGRRHSRSRTRWFRPGEQPDDATEGLSSRGVWERRRVGNAWRRVRVRRARWRRFAPSIERSSLHGRPSRGRPRARAVSTSGANPMARRTDPPGAELGAAGCEHRVRPARAAHVHAGAARSHGELRGATRRMAPRDERRPALPRVALDAW